jgi:hypothetical protein
VLIGTVRACVRFFSISAECCSHRLLQAQPYAALLLQQVVDMHAMLADVSMAPAHPLSLLGCHPLELFARALAASDDDFATVRTGFPRNHSL